MRLEVEAPADMRRRAKDREVREITQLSLTDPLTGLYNRRGYELMTNQVLKDAARGENPVMLMFFDVDGLKRINDDLGHEVGNDAILATAAILRSTFRESDVVARLGGDEFCVVGALPGTGTDGSAQLSRIDAAVGLYNDHEGRPFRLSLSGGIATFDPSAPVPLEHLEAEADRRMYADKRSRSLRPS